MANKPKKMRFHVEEGESISDCLARMEQEGYKPKRRIEKPIFKDDKDGVEPVGREIIFEGVLEE